MSGCRQHVSVGQLRDELLSYYQSLKSAMVELINKDYADFVELSSNLVSASLFLVLVSLIDAVGWNGQSDSSIDHTPDTPPQ